MKRNTRKTQKKAEAITDRQHYFLLFLIRQFATRFIKDRKRDFMYLEMYLRNDLKHSICTRYYKTYKGALNHIYKQTQKAFKNDYQRVLASKTIFIIKDDLGRTLCNCNYKYDTNEFIILESDNIGRPIQKTYIYGVIL